jgi:hypothetical protein
MDRCMKKPEATPAYPSIRAFVRRYGRRAGAGLLVGAVATSAGCDWLPEGILNPKPEDDTGYHLDGMIAETAESWSMQLPLFGERDLYFSEPYGWIQYHLYLEIEGTPLYDWLRSNAEEALAIVDAILGAREVTTYEHDDGFLEVEAEILPALRQAYVDATGDSRGRILALDLYIEAYEDQDDILGDTTQAR